MERQREQRTGTAAIGFAAAADGEGLALAVVLRRGDVEPRTFRIRFPCRPQPALQGRDVGYAAVNAAALELLRLGLRRVEFRVDDSALAADLAGRRKLPHALTVPYVTLGCTLNRFQRATVVWDAGESRELSRRARAETARRAAA